MNKINLGNYKKLSIWKKFNIIIITSGIIILSVNAIIWKTADVNIKKIDSVYGDNVSLNELQSQLVLVQNDMEVYLETKTSQTMEQYYSDAEDYRVMVENLDSQISNNKAKLMEKNIKALSETYISLTEETVAAKRARNVEKYKEKYEDSTRLYNYISTYIYSLNNQQFKNNSEKYESMLKTLHLTEGVSMAIMISLILVVLILVTLIVSRLTASEELREQMRVENLIREKEHEMETSVKDAKLKYLQAQIHPHFLFNTLNAGAQLAMLEDAPRSYDYMQNIAAFYRYNLRNNAEVTLKDELELIDNYIYILNVRFAGEINYERQIDESILSQKMPGMILQPIIENSVNYGIRNIERDKCISLEASVVDDMVCIAIRDNGVGISQEKIDQIMSGEVIDSDKSNSNGVGLSNVINRLKLYYKSDEIMTIESLGNDVGTEVVLYLPLNIEKGDD